MHTWMSPILLICQTWSQNSTRGCLTGLGQRFEKILCLHVYGKIIYHSRNKMSLDCVEVFLILCIFLTFIPIITSLKCEEKSQFPCSDQSKCTLRSKVSGFYVLPHHAKRSLKYTLPKVQSSQHRLRGCKIYGGKAEKA